MRIRNIFRSFILLSSFLLFVGCGEGSSNSTEETYIGYLVDSDVSGVSYTDGLNTGITDEDGAFTFSKDRTISFTVGRVVIGKINTSSIKEDNIIYPTDIVGVERSNTTNIRVIRILQFLQSLDSDNNPSNGISIDKETSNLLDTYIFNMSDEGVNEEEIKTIIENIGKIFVSEVDAINHFINTVKTAGLLESTVPIFVSSSGVNVLENQSIALVLSASDKDNDTLIYSISGSDASEFTIDSSTGLVTFNIVPDYETKDYYTFTAFVNDGTNSVNQTVTISIIDIDESIEYIPVFTSSASTSVAENQTSALTVSARDGNNDTLTYSISGSDASYFNINMNSGVVTFYTVPDYETKDSYTFVASVSDGKNSVNQDVTILITDVNEYIAHNPVFTSSSSVIVEENQTSALTLSASDGNGDTLTYSISDGNSNDFSVDASTGIVTFNTAPDYETKDSYIFTASVSDKTSTVNQTIIILITDVNEYISHSPIFTSQSSVSVEENQTSALTLSASDGNNDTLTYSISDGNSNDFTVDTSTGVVTFNTAPDYETKVLYSFTATVSDGTNNVSQNINIIILDVFENTSPIFTSQSSVSVEENQSSVLTLNASDGNGDILTYSISDGDSASFTVNVSTGVVTFNTAPDYETKDSYTFTATVSDGISNDTQSITVNITNKNDNIPELTSDSSITAKENQTSVITLVANDEDGDTLAYSISGTDVSSFSINSITGVVTFNTEPDYETKDSYTFIASVNDGTNSDSQTVTVTILEDLYIKSAIYHNNRTIDVSDDILYVYFNEDIDSSSIGVDMSTNYDIDGTGYIGSDSSSEYTNTLFYRHKISLNSIGTSSISFEDDGTTKISLSPNSITYSKGNHSNDFPNKYPKIVVNKFDVFSRVKTGQTTSYETNDDGDTQRGITRSFTNNGDDTVTDNVTGLMWKDDTTLISKNYADAITYCENLSFAGYSDWYLPSIEELVSIVDKGEFDPAIDSTFTNTVSSTYWSSSRFSSNYVIAHFDKGIEFYGRYNSNEYYVRCLRLNE